MTAHDLPAVIALGQVVVVGVTHHPNVLHAVFAANADRTRWHPRPRRVEPRRAEAGVKIAQIRKARRESEAIDFVNRFAVAPANLLESLLS